MADSLAADSAMADSVLAEAPTMGAEGFEQAGFGSDNAPWFAHPTVQKAIQFFPVIVMLIMQIYFHTRGPIKGKKKTLEEAADAADPTVFFDITIGGKAAGRIESELSRMLFTPFGLQQRAHAPWASLTSCTPPSQCRSSPRSAQEQ